VCPQQNKRTWMNATAQLPVRVRAFARARVCSHRVFLWSWLFSVENGVPIYKVRVCACAYGIIFNLGGACFQTRTSDLGLNPREASICTSRLQFAPIRFGRLFCHRLLRFYDAAAGKQKFRPEIDFFLEKSKCLSEPLWAQLVLLRKN